MDWLRQMVGLSDAWTGVIARHRQHRDAVRAAVRAREGSSFSQNRGGLQARRRAARRLRLEPGPQLDREGGAARGVREGAPAAHRDRRRARAARRPAGGRDRCGPAPRAGVPCALVASIGTTGTTAIDPLAAMAAVAKQHGLWLHVDAALAGTAMVLPECRPLWDGVERADSLVFNPHKWMGVGFDFCAYYVRDPQHLIRVMSTNPSYLRTAQDGAVKNYRDWHIPLGRRFRALKLLVPPARRRRRGDPGADPARPRERAVARSSRWMPLRTGSGSRPCRSRRCACATFPRRSPATSPPSPATTSRSRAGSTRAARPTSRRRC